MRHAQRIILALVLLAFSSTPSAHAYIDPATGSYVLQILVAGFLGAMFALKLFWHRIVLFFQGLFSRSRAGNSAGDPSD
ncbi:MAG: hypothetical protein ACE5GX_08395 [Thermoanaerobaculia bacterium]